MIGRFLSPDLAACGNAAAIQIIASIVVMHFLKMVLLVAMPGRENFWSLLQASLEYEYKTRLV